MQQPFSPPPRGVAVTANWGILAHVDAGKTSLTERLLYDSGAIDALGSVDAGTSRTDTMDIERRRGITVRTNVASFVIPTAGDPTAGVQVNLIDTPGHADFIAEVERSLAVLDGAVLVVSAVEGVQPQTVVLWRAIHRLGLPAVVFVNKIDRAGADPDRVVAELQRRLAEPADVGLLPLSGVVGAGTRDAAVRARDLTADDSLEVLADHDLALLGDVLSERDVRADRAWRGLLRSWASGEVVPVLMGSALTGAGVGALMQLMGRLPLRRDTQEAPTSALVFKIENDDDGRRVWARMFGGELSTRDRYASSDARPERVTELSVSAPGGAAVQRAATAGDVVQVRGLSRVRIGDWIGTPSPARPAPRFAAPTLEAVVDAADDRERGRMYAALTTLAEQDPLIDLRIDDERGEVAVSLFGEVQKDVIAALLADQFGVEVRFRETTTQQIERVAGEGAAHALMAEGTTTYLASLGFTVQAAAPGTGLDFDIGSRAGTMPAAFYTATRQGVVTGLAQGRHGWPILDARVTLTHTGYLPRQSHAHQRFSKKMSSIGADFRNLAPMLVHQALAQAGTVVCEPVNAFTLDTSADTLDAVIARLARLEGVVTDLQHAHDRVTLTGTLPARQARPLTQTLADLTRGEGILAVEHDHYQPVVGRPPTRPRVGPDPLDADTWQRERPR